MWLDPCREGSFYHTMRDINVSQTDFCWRRPFHQHRLAKLLRASMTLTRNLTSGVGIAKAFILFRPASLS